ncbi:MAG: LAGLIDADG endonuclease [bacterium]|nr:LAGLIDADG endonuclease [bacterium]
MANTKVFHQMRVDIILNATQREIVVGTVLGDGSLIETFSKKNLRLQIEQCDAQKSYVFWKYEMLESLICTPPRYQEKKKSWRVRTISHPDITEIGFHFYNGRKKVIPNDFELFLTPLALAVWFMDDGSRDQVRGTYILNTQCFTKAEVERIRIALQIKFGLSPISIHKDKSGWRLYIQKPSSKRFETIVSPFILPVMEYKIGKPRRDYTSAPAKPFAG